MSLRQALDQFDLGLSHLSSFLFRQYANRCRQTPENDPEPRVFQSPLPAWLPKRTLSLT